MYAQVREMQERAGPAIGCLPHAGAAGPVQYYLRTPRVTSGTFET